MKSSGSIPLPLLNVQLNDYDSAAYLQGQKMAVRPLSQRGQRILSLMVFSYSFIVTTSQVSGQSSPPYPWVRSISLPNTYLARFTIGSPALMHFRPVKVTDGRRRKVLLTIVLRHVSSAVPPSCASTYFSGRYPCNGRCRGSGTLPVSAFCIFIRR
jgi:hypothetical protein